MTLRRVFKAELVLILICAFISAIFLTVLHFQTFVKLTFNPANAYVYTRHSALTRIEISSDGTPEIYRSPLPWPISSMPIFGNYRKAQSGQIKRVLFPQQPDKNKAHHRKNYLYLSDRDTISLDVSLRSNGSSIFQEHPLVNRVIIQFRRSTEVHNLKLSLTGFPIDKGYSTFRKQGLITIEAERPSRFGKWTYFQLPRRIYVTSVKLLVQTQESSSSKDTTLGVRTLHLYLHRDKSLALVSKAQKNMSKLEAGGQNSSSLSGTVDVLTTASKLDPYSPRINYLLSKAYHLRGRHEKALNEVKRAFNKLTKYSPLFAADCTLQPEELYRLKAKIAGSLGDWDTAISAMNQASYEKDFKYLSLAYYHQYLINGDKVYLERSVESAIQAIAERPVQALSVVEQYPEQGALLTDIVKYIDVQLSSPRDKRYQLNYFGSVSLYSVVLFKGLIFLKKQSTNQLNTRTVAFDDYELAQDQSEKALLWAVNAEIWDKLDRPNLERQLANKALGYFDEYYQLYDSWAKFVRRDR